MNLDQLEILIQVKKETFKAIPENKEDLNYLIKQGWVLPSLSKCGCQLTDRAESRLTAILSIPSTLLDEDQLQNYIDLINYEIKDKFRKRAKDFIKNREIRVKLHTHPEIMNELINRYTKEGWEAKQEQNSIYLKWIKPFDLFREAKKS